MKSGIVTLVLLGISGCSGPPLKPTLNECEKAAATVAAVEACYAYSEVGYCLLKAQDLKDRLEAIVYLEKNEEECKGVLNVE